MLKQEFWPLVRSGKKRITIRRFARFQPGEEVFIHSGGKIVGKARILSVYKKRMGEIGEEEARKEGIPLEKLKRTLENTYGKNPEQMLTVVEFELTDVFDPPLDPEEMHYRGLTPREIAEEALNRGIVKNPEEREILEKIARGKSIREVAFEMGGLGRRKIIRKILRKYRELLDATSS